MANIIEESEEYFQLGPQPWYYQKSTVYPTLSRKLVEDGLAMAESDGLQLPPDVEIVILPRTPNPYDDKGLESTYAFFTGLAPNRIYLLPRNPKADMTYSAQNIVTTLKRHLADIESMILEGFSPKVIGLMVKRILEVSGGIVDLLHKGPVAFISYAIKHEAGHLLQHRYRPDVVAAFQGTDYFSLLGQRGFRGPCDHDILDKKEAVAEDFVQTLQNPLLPNIYCMRDVVDKRRAIRGRDIVARVITAEMDAEAKRIRTESSTALDNSANSSPLIGDINPLTIFQRNLAQVDSHKLREWAREMEAELESEGDVH